MHFTPTIDFGHVLTVVAMILAAIAGHRHWAGKVGDDLAAIKREQTEARKRVEELGVKVDKIDTHLDTQTVSMTRMEERVIDPLRRFAEMERECSILTKTVTRMEVHAAELERRLEEARAEIAKLRDWRHEVAQTAQLASTAAEIAKLKGG